MFSIDTIESIITKGYAQKQSPRVALKEGVLKNFAKSTGKHLYQSLFFNKVAEHA